MALGQGVRELKWMHSLLEEIQLRTPQQLQEVKDEEDAVNQLQEEHRRKNKNIHSQTAESSEQVPFDFLPPSTLLTDNQSASALVHQRGAMATRSKHIDVRHHHIREVVASGAAQVEWVPTEIQLADMFTKSLDRNTFHRLRNSIMGEEEVEDKNKQKNNITTAFKVSRSPDQSRLPSVRGGSAATDGSRE